MALVLTQQVETTIPIEVQGITPDRLQGNSVKQIAGLPIWHGRQQLELGEVFKVSGSMDDATIIWDGNLKPVHWIGAGMEAGNVQIETDAGRHVGSQMSGGEISANASVSDFLGAEMSGGLIRVAGNAGDLVGGNNPGSKFGMNRGSIFVGGDVGKGAGQSMRRGTIAIGGDTGELTGWNMLAGTILVFGSCDENVGAGMIRGTIVLAGGHEKTLLPTFSRGGEYPVPVLSMLANWLTNQGFDFDPDVLKSTFREFNGDLIQGGRGEVFIKT
jgi:formylmethanofuran dehydrogenase subunit C